MSWSGLFGFVISKSNLKMINLSCVILKNAIKCLKKSQFILLNSVFKKKKRISLFAIWFKKYNPKQLIFFNLI